MAMRQLKTPKWEAEAQESLRFIRDLMDRPTRHSTFSGPSGIFAGITSLTGCLVTARMNRLDPGFHHEGVAFMVVWAWVVFVALLADFLITKRPAARVGKLMLSRLGRQMFLAAVPALFMGGVLTVFFWRHDLLSWIYPIWMLAYGCALCSVGTFSPSHVRVLGCTFLAFGAVTLLIPQDGLLMTGLSFGVTHIVYGSVVSPSEVSR